MDMTQDDGMTGARQKALVALIRKMYRIMNKSEDELQDDLKEAGVDAGGEASGETLGNLADMKEDLEAKVGDAEDDDEDEDLKAFFHGRKPAPMEGALTVMEVNRPKRMPAPPKHEMRRQKNR